MHQMSGETHTPNTRVGLQLHSIPALSLSLYFLSLSPLSLSLSLYFLFLYTKHYNFTQHPALSLSLISWSRTCCCRVSQMDILSSLTRCVGECSANTTMYLYLCPCLASVLLSLFQSDLSPSRSGQGCQRRPRTSS